MPEGLPEGLDSEEALEETPKSPVRRGPLGVELVAEPSVLRQSRILAGDKNSVIGHLANLIAEDPVITIELLRVANATFFSADRPSITTVPAALVRLGSEIIIELLTTLAHRPAIEDREVALCFESLRALAKRTATVSHIIGQVMRPDISEMCHTAGLMTPVGHMIACAYLGRKYVVEAKKRKRNALAYKLNQEYGYNLPGVQLDYLRYKGLPQLLFYGLDRDLVCKSSAQSALRFIVESATEMVDAWENEKWDKYKPGKTLPPKSSLRLLKMVDTQYIAIYDTVDAFLHNRAEEREVVEERIKRSSGIFAALSEAELSDEADDTPLAAAFEDLERTSDYLDNELETKTPLSFYDEESLSRSLAQERREKRTLVVRRNGFEREQADKRPTLVLNRSGFAGYDASSQPTNFLTGSEKEIQEEQKTLSPDAQKVLELIAYLCRESENVQTLLDKLLKLLITEGPYLRAALLLLSEHRQTAEIYTAVGEGFVEEDEIRVNDPLSPLALALTQIKSFNSQTIEDTVSPFGISSYAISPIRVKSSCPVVLYADCGVDLPLPMEARRIFRLVVGLLNQSLPRLKGDLPKKLLQS